MQALLAFARAAWRQKAAWPVANLAGLFTNALLLLFRAAVIGACYRSRAEVGALSEAEAVGYVALTQATLMVAPQWGAVGLASDVRTGQIAVELLRPTDFVARFFASRLGVSAYYAAFRMAPLLVIAVALGFLPPPASIAGFLGSLALAVLVSNGILFLVEVSSFWLETERGLRYLVSGVGLVASGLVLPLSWFPAPVRALFLATPFPYTLHLPATLWLGSSAPDEVARGVAVQVAWAVGLPIACRWAFARGTRQLVLNGG
jgi:ABC-2 type transport system permease protein